MGWEELTGVQIAEVTVVVPASTAGGRPKPVVTASGPPGRLQAESAAVPSAITRGIFPLGSRRPHLQVIE